GARRLARVPLGLRGELRHGVQSRRRGGSEGAARPDGTGDGSVLGRSHWHVYRPPRVHLDDRDAQGRSHAAGNEAAHGRVHEAPGAPADASLNTSLSLSAPIPGPLPVAGASVAAAQQQSNPPKAEDDVNINRGGPAWWANPTWIAIGAIAVVLLAVVVG